MKKKTFKKLSKPPVYKFLFLLISLFSSTIQIKSSTNNYSNNFLTPDIQFENNILGLGTQFEKENFLKVSPLASRRPTKSKKKPWTFAVYMSADNNLRNFAARNIKQLTEIGSNQYINIVVQLDIKINGNTKITRRYYIEKNQAIHINANDPSSQQMDSGDPETLISFCKWAFETYPADDYALILWNHGTGCLDPLRGRIFNPIDLFLYNPSTNKFNIDRTVGFIDRIENQNTQRGICWDDTTGNYLTNQKLDYALKTITQTTLKGEKISIIGFDACLMSMLEIGNLVKPYAHIMVGSVEVEWAPGWEYAKVLSPFIKQTINKQEFAQNIVNMYAQYYGPITNDFAQSAIDLNNLDSLENIVNNISLLLTEALQKQVGNNTKKALWLSQNKAYCTSFDEPTFKDLHHFFCNLQNNLNLIQLINKNEEKNIKNNLYTLLEDGKKCIEKVVLANKVGKNLSKSKGLSIYFPEHSIHPSYQLTNFAKTNAWYTFLQQYLTT